MTDSASPALCARMSVAVAAVFSATGLRAEDPRSYFPPALLYATMQCGSLFDGRAVPVVSDIESKWFSSQLHAAQDPPLFTRARVHASLPTAIRFTWLRSFHPPVIVRIEDLAGARPRLIAKQLSGKGGYAPGVVSKRRVRSLSIAQVSGFRRLIAATRVLALPPKDCDIGADGAAWLIEGVDDTGYHLVSRWSPDHGEVRAIGLAMLALTGWRFAPVY